MSTEVFLFPASFAQERLWFLDQWQPGTALYNTPLVYRLEGPVDVEALEQALNEIVRRHDSLRTTFSIVDGTLQQVISDFGHINLQILTPELATFGDRESQAQQLAFEEARRPFDLARGPLIRAILIRLSPTDHFFVIALHHIVSDGWSMGVIYRELSALYSAFADRGPSPLAELPIQYPDYAVWQRERLRLDEHLSFWKKQLAGAPELLDLPTDRPRPRVPNYEAARQRAPLSREVAAELSVLARREGVTFFMVLLAVFQILLQRYSNQEDIVVGTPVANRNRAETEGLIGLFINMVAMRTSLAGDPAFNELLKRVREVALDAYAHQDLPFDKLVEELRPARSTSHNAIFQVMFALQNAAPELLKLRGVKTTEVRPVTLMSDLDLSFEIVQAAGHLDIEVSYRKDLFNADTITRLIGHFQTLLDGALANSRQRISNIQILTSAERRLLIEEWNCSREDREIRDCIHQVFEAHAAECPTQLAVVCRELSITYEELNKRANQLARRLQRLGVRPEVPVGVCVERSVTMIVALLAVLKSGGAYLPLDPAYPAERLEFMIDDSGSPVLLADGQSMALLGELNCHRICLDDWTQFSNEQPSNPTSAATLDNIAYVIYTSGSTGRPKGVEVTHRTVVHLFEATREQIGIVDGDIYTVVHSSAFDFSVWEIWGSLLQRGRLIVVPLETVQSPVELYELLCRERVTVLNQTPSALRALLEAKEASQNEWSVRLIVCGGDAMDNELAAQLSELDVPVWNFYGPTENTVWTTCGLVERSDEERALNSIGSPIPGIQVFLLDRHGHPVPVGVPGELFIGGAGLARGYLKRPQLTAEKFVPNSIDRQFGARLYRTGDVARYRNDGKLEFVGRADHQIKLRGFRIELGEIEAVLSRQPGVGQAVTIVREDREHDQRIVAYIVPEGDLPSASELRRGLQTSLPDYMVPSAFVTLSALPLSTNKKLDRAVLPAPDYGNNETSDVPSVFKTPTEEILTAIFADVLGIEAVGPNDNFFEAGGHSLLATQVVSRIRDSFHIDLSLRTLFERPTATGLADEIAQAVRTPQGLTSPPLLRVERNERLPVSFAQQRLWFLDQLAEGSAFYNFSSAWRLKGALNIHALERAIFEIVRRHESLRTVFDEDNGLPFQRVLETPSLPLPVVELTGSIAGDDNVDAELKAEVYRPFDLSRDLLLRAKLFRIAADDQILTLTVHHIAVDGWSIGILFRELVSLYEAFARDLASPLKPLPIQYADFAAWQRSWLQAEVLERFVSYWRNQLAGAPGVLQIPTDKPRPAVQTFRGAHQSLRCDAGLTNRLKSLSRTQGVTLFMTCLAGFDLLISRLTGQTDLVIGTDVANRNQSQTEQMIGFFTNLLPLRARISPAERFTSFLHQIRDTTLDAYAHQELPFEKLVEELRPPRDLSRNPLVQVLLVMQNQPAQRLELTGIDSSPLELSLESSRFDLVLFLSEAGDELEGLWLYNPDLFEASTISDFSTRYRRLLENIVGAPDAQVDSYEALQPEGGRKKMDKPEQQLQSNRLRGMRRTGVDLATASRVKRTFLQSAATLPLVISPDTEGMDLVTWIVSNKPSLEEDLLTHGAILFRDFGVSSITEFEQAAGAMCSELFAEYGDLPREPMGGKVYGSTPYPTDETILFHNESSHMHRWPRFIWFYCVKAAIQGGESPILDCRKIYQTLDPEVRDRFEEKGLMYVRNFTPGLDVSWQDFFHTSERGVVEEYCRNASINFEWTSNNGLRTRQSGTAIVTHPDTGDKVFFNQVQLHHPACLSPAVRESLLSMLSEEDLPRNVYYGDGSRIDDSVMDYLGDLYRRNAVSFPWQEGDILMLDNMLVSHSRNPFVGERKIVVALGKMVSNAHG